MNKKAASSGGRGGIISFAFVAICFFISGILNIKNTVVNPYLFFFTFFPLAIFIIVCIYFFKIHKLNIEKITKLSKHFNLTIYPPYSSHAGMCAKGIYKKNKMAIEFLQRNILFSGRNWYGLGYSGISVVIEKASMEKLCLFNDGTIRVKESFFTKEHTKKTIILAKIKEFEEALLKSTGWVMTFDTSYCKLAINLSDVDKIIQYIELMYKISEKLK